MAPPLPHGFRHVPVPHRRAHEVQRPFPQERLKPQVRHHRRYDRVTGQAAGSLQAIVGEDRQQVVTVQHRTGGIAQQNAIRIAVEREAIRAGLLTQRGQPTIRMFTAAGVVDRALAGRVKRQDISAQRLKQGRGGVGRGTTGEVHHQAQPLERAVRSQPLKRLLHVGGHEVTGRGDAVAPRRERRRRTGHQSFDVQLFVDGELAAGGREGLDAVVRRGVVGRAQHTRQVIASAGHGPRQRRGRQHPRVVNTRTRFAQSRQQLRPELGPAGPRVASQDDHRLGATGQLVGELAKRPAQLDHQLGPQAALAGDVADAVRAEELARRRGRRGRGAVGHRDVGSLCVPAWGIVPLIDILGDGIPGGVRISAVPGPRYADDRLHGGRR